MTVADLGVGEGKEGVVCFQPRYVKNCFKKKITSQLYNFFSFNICISRKQNFFTKKFLIFQGKGRGAVGGTHLPER